MFPNQIFCTQIESSPVIQSWFKSNHDLDLPITGINSYYHCTACCSAGHVDCIASLTLLITNFKSLPHSKAPHFHKKIIWRTHATKMDSELIRHTHSLRFSYVAIVSKSLRTNYQGIKKIIIILAWQFTILWKVSSGWHENYMNYSLDDQNNILCYWRFDFTSEVFIRTDFR